MKKTHYIHFGMPRTATTWLYYNLIKHPEVDYSFAKENGYLHQKSNGVEDHIEHFKDYNISFNTHPFDWKLPDEVLSQLDSFATHYGVSFRNPYEYLHSLKNFMRETFPPPEWVKTYLDQGHCDYVGVITRLKQFCKKPMLLMVCDDLEKNPQAYMDAITSHLGIANMVDVDTKKLNWRHYIIDIEFTPEDVARINKYVDEFSAYMGRDFSHWKRGV